MKMKLRLILAATLLTGLLAPHLLAQEQAGAGTDTNAPPSVTPAPPQAKPEAKKKPATKKKTGAEKKAAPAKAPPPAEPDQSTAVIHPGPAIAKEKNVNVRGQAAINSEIVTHLKRGDMVTVLQEVTTPKPGDAEITKWAKIALPSGVHVWVSSLYVDDNKTVKATQLRLRAGPGENYSTLGMIKKGTVIKEIETKGDWIKIDAPPEAYGFVAAHLLTNAPAAEIAAAKSPAVTAPPPAPAPVVPPPAPTTVSPPEPVAPPQPITPAAQVKPPETNPPAVTPPPAEATPPAIVAEATPPTPPPTTPAPAAPSDEPLVKRIVSREGYVRNTVSIQAPSYFKLESLDTKRTINYIYSPTTNILLRDFFGKRIIITGEEVLDERWPNTPVINVESITTVN